MSWDGGGEVRYRRKAGHDSAPRFTGQPEERFDPAEFLARVLMHIPEPRRHRTHYYGAYSNASRGRRRRELKAAAEAGEPPEPGARQATTLPDERRLRRRWSQLIKRVYEVDPLVCPSCGGQMRVVAFILEYDVVDAILRHLERTGRHPERGPPQGEALPAVAS